MRNGSCVHIDFTSDEMQVAKGIGSNETIGTVGMTNEHKKARPQHGMRYLDEH